MRTAKRRRGGNRDLGSVLFGRAVVVEEDVGPASTRNLLGLHEHTPSKSARTGHPDRRTEEPRSTARTPERSATSSVAFGHRTRAVPEWCHVGEPRATALAS